ncbi:MAG TPA: alpha-amylase family glycosyl hydrolase, partial [Thermomicrobiales bacterium]|nr:alpha-amylase family glycosyl hydrolase [Thermomicrobiales bacterium]
MSNETWQGTRITESGVEFAVWAPGARAVELEFINDEGPWYVSLDRQENGVWTADVAEAAAGTRYKYRVDGGYPCPDPRSRFQPDGVHGPSEVVDPGAYGWTDQAWPGIQAENQVFYELHVGTYTGDGTFAALERELAELKRLGITAIELMPIAQSPGERNWGYDGVDLFAPSSIYGRPDDLRSLVDAAHR